MIERKTGLTLAEKSLMTSAALLIFAGPLAMNMYKEVFELVASLLGTLMLVILFWNPSTIAKTGYLYVGYIVLSLLFVAIYLVPFPDVSLWEQLPGRELYTRVAQFISAQGVALEYPALSLIPENTKRALFYLIPLVALFLTAMYLPKRAIKGLLVVLLAITFFEAALGLIQYASGADAFYLGNKEHGDTASGTYRNRDHYVGMLEMVLPMVIAMLVSPFTLRSRKVDSGDNQERVLSTILTLSFLAILILMSAFFSASRAGIGLIILGLLLSAFIFSYEVGRIKSFGFLLVSSVIGIGVVLNVGIVPILNRFATDPMEDERWRIFENTERLISSMFPWGSGPGTFPEVYRAFQPIEQPNFVNHAHNDFIEVIADMGVFGVIIIAGFFVLYLSRWIGMLRSRQQEGLQVLQTGAGIGMLLLLLHSYVDFNFREMANALIFVFLAGIFFRKRWA